MDFLVFHRNRIASFGVLVDVTDDDAVACIVASTCGARFASDFRQNCCGNEVRKKRISRDIFAHFNYSKSKWKSRA